MSNKSTTMPTPSFNPAFLHTALLAFLLIASPFAMLFSPHDEFCTDLSFQADSIHWLRASFIAAGLIAAPSSVILLIWELIKRSNQTLQTEMFSKVVLQVSITICSVTIGWAAIPYWVNGVFQAYLGNRPPDCYLNAFDPKRLMPITWIGETWRIGVVLIFYVALLMGIALFLVTIALSIKERRWKEYIATWACLAIPMGILFVDKGYMVWLMD